MHRALLFVCLVLLLAGAALAADWPQWRGPDRDGVAKDGPPLAEAWPDTGPRRVWVSEERILSGTVQRYAGGGWGSVSVADGRVYCSYVAPRKEKIDTRTLTKQALGRLGWHKVKPPDDLLAKIEQARASDERSAIKDRRKLAAWIGAWVKAHLADGAARKHRAFATDRLKRGRGALDLAVLDRLATIADKPFPNQAALDAWFAENGIDGGIRKAVQARVPTTKMYRDTVVICMDAATGRTVWKKVFTGGPFYTLYENAAASGTPCIANGKVYLTNRLVAAVGGGGTTRSTRRERTG